MPIDPTDQAWLERFLRDHGGIAGTVHREVDDDLHVTAAVNIPPPVLAAVTLVTRGKGMAGLAQVRAEPVQTCNLQEDSTGRINPMAKLVGGQAAIALPIIADAGDVRAVVGIAFDHDGEIDGPTVGRLADGCRTLPPVGGVRP